MGMILSSASPNVALVKGTVHIEFLQNKHMTLHWYNYPIQTKSFAIIIDNPSEAQDPVYFIAYNIGVHLDALDITGLKDEIGYGFNRNGSLGWSEGPVQQPLRLKIYALRSKLNLNSGATKQELMRAMDGKVLAVGSTWTMPSVVHH